jgi:hypothetical protein
LPGLKTQTAIIYMTKMNQETAKYIIRYFFELLTSNEKMAISHARNALRLHHSTSDTTDLARIYAEKGWLTKDQSVLDLLKDGYRNFEMNVANRIMSESEDKVFFNNCLNCGKLVRTPYARQCQHCGHSWHELTVAQFKLKSSFQVTGHHFFLMGEITKGEIKPGNFMDLIMLGLNKKPKIETIEFARKQKDGNAFEEIGLGTNELTVEDKAFLKWIGAFRTPFDIITK